MSRRIKLRNNLNSIFLSKSNHVSNILFSINLRVTVIGFSKFRVRVKHKRERLIINNVPMKNIEFG